MHAHTTLIIRRIFLASPGDVKKERELFVSVVERVNKVKAKPLGILLEPCGWEDLGPGSGRPQELINEEQLLKSDLVVMLLWARWGSPTGEYSSGFEEEYNLADTNEIPIWFYFREISEQMLADPGPQLQKVLDFRDRIEGEKRYCFDRYSDEGSWAEAVFEDLCKWLDKMSTETCIPIGLSNDSSARLSDEPLSYSNYAERLSELENELKGIRSGITREHERALSERIEKAFLLAKEARGFADTNHFTKAEEHFAKALSYFEDLTIIGDYGLLLKHIGSLDRSQAKLSQALRIANETNNYFAQGKFLFAFGSINRIQGNMKASEKFFKDALGAFEAIGHNESCADVYTSLGNLNRLKGNLSAADVFNKKALAIYEEIDSKRGIILVYTRQGIIHMMRGNFIAAEQKLQKALAIAEEPGQRELTSEIVANLGAVYIQTGDLDLAETMLNRALEMDKKRGSKEGLAAIYGNLGIVYSSRSNFADGNDMFKKALALEQELGHKEGILQSYGGLGINLMKQGDFIGAEEMINRALKMSEDIDLRNSQAISYSNLGELYLMQNKFEAAYNAYTKSLALYREVGNKIKAKELKDFLANFRRKSEPQA